MELVLLSSRNFSAYNPYIHNRIWNNTEYHWCSYNCLLIQDVKRNLMECHSASKHSKFQPTLKCFYILGLNLEL